jgi:hypothetical protein
MLVIVKNEVAYTRVLWYRVEGHKYRRRGQKERKAFKRGVPVLEVDVLYTDTNEDLDILRTLEALSGSQPPLFPTAQIFLLTRKWSLGETYAQAPQRKTKKKVRKRTFSLMDHMHDPQSVEVRATGVSP